MMQVDTSREAVERLISMLERNDIHHATKTLRALLDQQDTTKGALESAVSKIQTLRWERDNARREAFEACADLADHHMHGAAVAKSIRAKMQEG